ncbi:MAG: hypothetical protein M3546_12740 [Actinomycetota bacterium]|nr:hypothetical protein [Actinomycetota bacterium]
MGRRLVMVIGLAIALASVLVLAFVVLDGSDERTDVATELEIADIEAAVTLEPAVALFGDTVLAHVDILLDKTRVDPDSVRVAAQFIPFEIVGPPRRLRRDAGDSTYLRRTFVLRCLSGTCVPSGESARYEFPSARIAFEASDDGTTETSPINVPMPSVRVYSRFTALGAGTDRGSAPWVVDLLSLPSASYRLAPGLLIAMLLSFAALAALVGVFLGYLAWPPRVVEPEPEPEPELPPPPPPLSPLEQALLLLEQSIRVDGAADQRRALELVAEELELADWGDRDLARTARALAWSEGVPPIQETTQLATRVRTALPRAEDAETNGNGNVVV